MDQHTDRKHVCSLRSGGIQTEFALLVSNLVMSLGHTWNVVWHEESKILYELSSEKIIFIHCPPQMPTKTEWVGYTSSAARFPSTFGECWNCHCQVIRWDTFWNLGDPGMGNLSFNLFPFIRHPTLSEYWGYWESKNCKEYNSIMNIPRLERTNGSFVQRVPEQSDNEDSDLPSHI